MKTKTLFLTIFLMLALSLQVSATHNNTFSGTITSIEPWPGANRYVVKILDDYGVKWTISIGSGNLGCPHVGARVHVKRWRGKKRTAYPEPFRFTVRCDGDS